MGADEEFLGARDKYHCDRWGLLNPIERVWYFVKQIVTGWLCLWNLTEVQVVDLGGRAGCGSQAARLHLPNVTFTSQFDARLRQTSDRAQVANLYNTVALHTRHQTTQFPSTWPSPAPVSVKRAKFSAPTTVCFFFHDPPMKSPGLTSTSRIPPRRLRRPPPSSARHNRLPRRDPHRLHNRNMPLRRSQRVLLAAPENQSRRL